MITSRWSIPLLILLLLLSACAPLPMPLSPTLPAALDTPRAPAAMAPTWPTAEWPTSTPEQQGIDSERLAKMLGYIQQTGLELHSLLVIRHGYLALEVYFPPYGPDTRHNIYSCTKSIASALIGVAIAEGKIDGVDHRLLDFFPGRTIANVDERKQAITLEHVLTMSSGLKWTNRDNQMLFGGTSDLVQWVLDRPMAADPGAQWQYNSGGSHLLSAIIQETTGSSILAYARERLFEPLGIQNLSWTSDPTGLHTGGWGLYMTPRDMAKFGYLYLREGVWDGRQIVPADWVRESVRGRIAADNGRSYGYQWWTLPWGGYAALGYAGQQIIVAPERDMVVVFTADLPNQEGALDGLVEYFILPAAQSDAPLPDNPAGLEQLQSRIEAIE